MTLGNSGCQLAGYIVGETEVVFNWEDSNENTNPEEKENSEKKERTESEDYKETDMISQLATDSNSTLVGLMSNMYPEFTSAKVSVYLEHKTPPPQYR